MKEKTIRKVKHVKSEQLCEVYKQIAQFTRHLDTVANAAAIQKDKLKSVPVSMLPMVF